MKSKLDQYIIPKGKTAALRNGKSTTNLMLRESWLPSINNRKLKGFTIKAKFDESIIMDWKGDLDWMDWWKLSGIWENWRRPDRDNLMVGVRWNQLKKQIEFIVYRNWKYKIERSEVLLIGQPGDELTFEFKKTGKYTYDVRYTNETKQISADHQTRVRLNPRKMRILYPSFGGADNSLGPYGGKTSHDLFFEMSFEYFYDTPQKNKLR